MPFLEWYTGCILSYRISKRVSGQTWKSKTYWAVLPYRRIWHSILEDRGAIMHVCRIMQRVIIVQLHKKMNFLYLYFQQLLSPRPTPSSLHGPIFPVFQPPPPQPFRIKRLKISGGAQIWLLQIVKLRYEGWSCVVFTRMPSRHKCTTYV